MDTVTDQNTVAEIKAYLDAHDISYPSGATKADLLVLILVQAEEKEATNVSVDASKENSESSNVVTDESQMAPWEIMLMNHATRPAMEPSNDTYTVKEGETLADIATAHLMSLNKLKKLNRLTVNVLPAGRVIRLS